MNQATGDTEPNSGFPDRALAEEMLSEAAALNPGPWEAHSRMTAHAAQLIAESCDGLDPERAFVLGLLHDIGRRYGRTESRHIIDGYRYLCEAGFAQAGRVCLTHTFLLPEIESAMGTWDCTEEEYQFVQDFLDGIVYDNYDRLIQLCDFLAAPVGLVVAEKRMVDVALRFGPNEHMTQKWRTALCLKKQFDEWAGTNIYRILPGICENTLQWSLAPETSSTDHESPI
jgi:hypothetical protein